MKRFLLIASCAFLTAGMFSSCQKEEKSALDLAKDLTAELHKVTDLKSADAVSPRVEVLNKRFQNALVRPFASSATALQRSGDEDASGQEGAALQEALKALAKEVGRVQASLPVTEYDGEVNRDRLLLAVGAVNGAGAEATAAQRRSVGTAHMKGESEKSSTPGNFSDYEFYGSAKLREALDYTAAPGSVGAFDFEEDPTPIPAAKPIPEDEPEEPAADETPADDSSDSTSTDDDTTTTTGDDDDTTTTTSDDDDTPSISADDDDTTPSADDDSSSSDSDDDGGLPSLDIDSDSDSSSSSDDDSSSSDSDSGSDDDFGIEL